MERTPESGDRYGFSLPGDANSVPAGAATGERLRIRSPEDALAAIPYRLGFYPEESMVVMGYNRQEGSANMILRHDLGDESAELTNLIMTLLQKNDCDGMILVGYGASQEVTPVVDKLREAAADKELTVTDALRVEDGRYWSYLYGDDASFSPEGVLFNVETSVMASKMVFLGATAMRRRSELAELLEPLEARVRGEVFEEINSKLQVLAGKSIRQAVGVGLQHVQEAVRIARQGDRLDDRQVAWLVIAMEHPAVRDDAWARMDPAYCRQHRELWTDVMRRTPDGGFAAPGLLLAVAAWQCGDGVFANTALDRVERVDPDDKLMWLLRAAITGGLPPAFVRLAATPEEIAASYAVDFGSDSPDVLPLDFDNPEVRRQFDLPPRLATPEPQGEPEE